MDVEQAVLPPICRPMPLEFGDIDEHGPSKRPPVFAVERNRVGREACHVEKVDVSSRCVVQGPVGHHARAKVEPWTRDT